MKADAVLKVQWEYRLLPEEAFIGALCSKCRLVSICIMARELCAIDIDRHRFIVTECSRLEQRNE